METSLPQNSVQIAKCRLAFLIATVAATCEAPPIARSAGSSTPERADYALDASIRVLETANTFLSARVGYSGVRPIEVTALRYIASTENATEHFARLAGDSRFGPVTRLYGLCGLRVLASARFDVAVEKWQPRVGRVAYQSGCVVGDESIHRFLEPDGDRPPLLHAYATAMLKRAREPKFNRATADAAVAADPAFRAVTRWDLFEFLAHPNGHALLVELLKDPATKAADLDIALDALRELGPGARELAPLLESRVRGATQTPAERLPRIAAALIDASVWREDGIEYLLELMTHPELTTPAVAALLAQLGDSACRFARSLDEGQVERELEYDHVSAVPDLPDNSQLWAIQFRVFQWIGSGDPKGVCFPRFVPSSVIPQLVSAAVAPGDSPNAGNALVVAGAPAAKALVELTRTGDTRTRRAAAHHLEPFLARPSTWEIVIPAMRALAGDEDPTLRQRGETFLEYASLLR